MAFVIITSALIDHIHTACVRRNHDRNMAMLTCEICPDSNIAWLCNKSRIIRDSLPTAGACIPCIVAPVTSYSSNAEIFIIRFNQCNAFTAANLVTHFGFCPGHRIFLRMNSFCIRAAFGPRNYAK